MDSEPNRETPNRTAINPYATPRADLHGDPPQTLGDGPLRFPDLLWEVGFVVWTNPFTFLFLVALQLGVLVLLTGIFGLFVAAWPALESLGPGIEVVIQIAFFLITLLLFAWYHTVVVRISLPMVRDKSFGWLQVFQISSQPMLVFLGWLIPVPVLIALELLLPSDASLLHLRPHLLAFSILAILLAAFLVSISLAPSFLVDREMGWVESQLESITRVVPEFFPLAATLAVIGLTFGLASYPLILLDYPIPLIFWGSMLFYHPLWCITTTLAYFHVTPELRDPRRDDLAALDAAVVDE